jgi:hypothetical protein
MSTRYSLPPRERANEDDADIARRARGFVAMVLVIGLMGVMMWTAFVPPADPPLAVAPQAEESPPPASGGLPGA